MYKAVGVKIREARGERKQTMLASQVGLTRTSISNIERGRQKMLLHTFLDIAASLGVAPDRLLPDAPTLDNLKPMELPASLPPAERAFVRKGVAAAATLRRRS